jgi:hypothetical protein
MTRVGGDMDEMPIPTLDDRALETLMSGAHSPQSGFDWLFPFVRELETASNEPAPVPTPALATLLGHGFGKGQVELSPTDGRVLRFVPRPAPAHRRTRKLLVGGRTERAGVGVVAKAAIGLALVAASASAAGAMGALPDPVQHAVATVVKAVTPFDIPDPSDAGATVPATDGTNDDAAPDGAVPIPVRGVDFAAGPPAAGPPAATPTPNPPSPVIDAPGAPVATPTPTPTPSPPDPGAGPVAPVATPTPTPNPPDPGGSTGVGANPGATGLDRANQTPAADHVPDSVPGGGPPSDPGSPGATGLDRANQTPAADHVPDSVPGGGPPSDPGSPGATGLDRANQTPAADHVPSVAGPKGDKGAKDRGAGGVGQG